MNPQVNSGTPGQRGSKGLKVPRCLRYARSGAVEKQHTQAKTSPGRPPGSPGAERKATAVGILAPQEAARFG